MKYYLLAMLFSVVSAAEGTEYKREYYQDPINCKPLTVIHSASTHQITIHVTRVSCFKRFSFPLLPGDKPVDVRNVTIGQIGISLIKPGSYDGVTFSDSQYSFGSLNFENYESSTFSYSKPSAPDIATDMKSKLSYHIQNRFHVSDSKQEEYSSSGSVRTKRRKSDSMHLKYPSGFDERSDTSDMQLDTYKLDGKVIEQHGECRSGRLDKAQDGTIGYWEDEVRTINADPGTVEYKTKIASRGGGPFEYSVYTDGATPFAEEPAGNFRYVDPYFRGWGVVRHLAKDCGEWDSVKRRTLNVFDGGAISAACPATGTGDE